MSTQSCITRIWQAIHRHLKWSTQDIAHSFLEAVLDGTLLSLTFYWHLGSNKIEPTIIFDCFNYLSSLHQFLRLWSDRHTTFCPCYDKSSYKGCVG